MAGFKSPGDMRGEGNKKGSLERHIRSLQRTLTIATTPIDVAEVTSGTQAALTLTVPPGVAGVRVVGYFQGNDASTQTLNTQINGVTGTGLYRSRRITWAGDGTTPSSVFLSDNDTTRTGAIVPGTDHGSSIFGTAEFVFPPHRVGTGSIAWQVHGALVSTDAAGSVYTQGMGRYSGTEALASILMFPQAGSFVAGTRFELWGL